MKDLIRTQEFNKDILSILDKMIAILKLFEIRNGKIKEIIVPNYNIVELDKLGSSLSTKLIRVKIETKKTTNYKGEEVFIQRIFLFNNNWQMEFPPDRILLIRQRLKEAFSKTETMIKKSESYIKKHPKMFKARHPRDYLSAKTGDSNCNQAPGPEVKPVCKTGKARPGLLEKKGVLFHVKLHLFNLIQSGEQKRLLLKKSAYNTRLLLNSNLAEKKAVFVAGNTKDCLKLEAEILRAELIGNQIEVIIGERL